MIRELVLVSADLSAAPWFAAGVPPMPPLSPDIALSTVSTEVDLEIFANSPVPPSLAASRLTEGDACDVAVAPGSVLAAQMWSTERPRFIDWIGCNIRPPMGHVHVYNSWVRPEFRGLGLQWNLAAAACRGIAARGRTHMCAGVERREYPPFARKYAAMGLGLMAPYKSLWSLRILGLTAAVVAMPAPRCLETARRNALNVLARRAGRV